jgi:hypothetical protein
MSYLLEGFKDERAKGEYAKLLKEFRDVAETLLAYPQSDARDKALTKLLQAKESAILIAKDVDYKARQAKATVLQEAAPVAPKHAPLADEEPAPAPVYEPIEEKSEEDEY